MDLKFWKNKVDEAKSSTKNNAGANFPINNKNFKNFIIKASGLIAKQGAYREDFSYPEFDLEEIKVASMSDSYIKQSFMKYSYLIYKAGCTIKSENEKASEYVKKRFRIMSYATEKPVDILFQEVGDDLIKYSNSFLIKSRTDIVMPGIHAKGIFGEQPVGGYFRIDPTTMRIKRDDNGRVIGYMQTVNGKEKKYRKEDVVHFYLDKDPNSAFGTPRIIAAMEDVKLLRKIEGNVISLIYRFAIPIYQWMIGIPEAGFQATDREIDEAKHEIEKIALDGIIVTNERTNVKAIGAEGVALDATGYLKYFEQRVFTALGVSESQMGRGGAKKDADSMEAQVHDTVKYIQRTLAIFIENFIINELLLEGGFNPVTNDGDTVNYVFEETSLETKVKVENHEMLKYQSNITTLEETRRSLGKKEEVDEERLFSNLITQNNAIEQIREEGKVTMEVADAAFKNQQKATEQQAKTEASTGTTADEVTGIKGNGQTTSSVATNDIESRNRPENQHGKTSVKIKEYLDKEPHFLSKTHKDKESHKKVFQSVYKKWDAVRNDIEKGEDLFIMMGTLNDMLLREIGAHIDSSVQAGRMRALSEAKNTSIDTSALRINISQIEEDVNGTITSLLKDINRNLKQQGDAGAVFDSLEYRLRFLLEYSIPKAYWFGYAKTCGAIGINKVYVNFKGSHDAKDHDSVIDTQRIDWKSIPAFHAHCDCELSLKRVGEKK